MKSHRATRSYEELGTYLTKLRSLRYRSALALYKEALFSFSYSMYADFERGALLPALPAFLEIIDFLKALPQEAILTWLRVQLPTPELKNLFTSTAIATVTSAATATSHAHSTEATQESTVSAPSLDNTWTLGPKDKKILLTHPWLWDLITRISMVFPHEVLWQELDLKTNTQIKAFTKKFITSWIEDGRILVSNTGLALKTPHVHLPKTDDWHDIRLNNIRHGVERLLQNMTTTALVQERAYRGIWNRSLTPQQLKQWVQRLKKLETEFFAQPYLTSAQPGAGHTHTMLVAFGLRTLTGLKKK